MDRNEFVHVGLFKTTTVLTTASIRILFGERGRASDLFGQEISNVDSASFATQESVGNAGTLDIVTLIFGDVAQV